MITATPATVTTANCWSVRQCIERAAALDAQAETVVAGLDAFSDLSFDRTETRADEHQAAVDHIAALLQLTQHLICNLKGGMAIPPTPQPAPTPRRQSPPVTHARRAEQPPTYRIPHVEKPAKTPHKTQCQSSGYNGRAAARASAAKEGLLGVGDMLAALRISRGRFYEARSKGRVPEPHTNRAGMPFWTQAQLVACNLRRAS